MLEIMNEIPIKNILIVVYGGVFGWTLGKLPNKWVYITLALALLLTIVFVL